MKLHLLARFCVFLAGISPSWQQDDVFGNDYLVDELPGQQEKTEFRPKSAREAMKHASRVAQKIHSGESDQSYAVLQGPGIGGARGLRVQVRDAVAVTTSRYGFRRAGNFRKFQRRGSEEVPVMRRRTIEPVHPLPDSFSLRNNAGRSARRSRPLDRDRYRYLKKQKRTREKRAIEDRTRGHGFNLPPMPQDEEDAKKKKKKKKKKKSITDAPTTLKKIQKKNKKFRIYMESEELALGKTKGRASHPKIVENLSKELDQLLKKVVDTEEQTPPTMVMSTRAKYIQMPKNWQSPPSWRPPTRGPGKGAFRGRLRAYSEEIVTIGPQIISEESSEKPTAEAESSTTLNWKAFDHPLGAGKEKLVLKPPPEDWPAPTHPADGVYDWHKSQFKRGPRMRRPQYVTFFARKNNNQKHYAEETAMYRRNDMWQTRPYVRPPLPTLGPLPSTWPTIGTKWVFSLVPQDKVKGDVDIDKLYYSQGQRAGKRWPEADQIKEKEELHLSSLKQGQAQDEVHLTTGPPLAPVDWKKVDVNPPELKPGVGDPDHQESHHQSYRYGPDHAVWQGHSQGVRRDGHTHTRYQGHQQYYANYTNYYSQYYQNYYSQIANKSAAYHHEQAHHVQDKHSASGYYQSHYSYHGAAPRQSELRPPAYFHNPHEEPIPKTLSKEEINDFTTDEPHTTFEIPYRYPNEYAGNDRDLRAPPMGRYDAPSTPTPQLRVWGGHRIRRPGPLRRGYQMRQRRGGGFRPTGYRSIFTAPLHKFPWTTSAPR